jgi:hypothetical protein
MDSVKTWGWNGQGLETEFVEVVEDDLSVVPTKYEERIVVDFGH